MEIDSNLQTIIAILVIAGMLLEMAAIFAGGVFMIIKLRPEKEAIKAETEESATAAAKNIQSMMKSQMETQAAAHKLEMMKLKTKFEEWRADQAVENRARTKKDDAHDKEIAAVKETVIILTTDLADANELASKLQKRAAEQAITIKEQGKQLSEQGELVGRLQTRIREVEAALELSEAERAKLLEENTELKKGKKAAKPTPESQ